MCLCACVRACVCARVCVGGYVCTVCFKIPDSGSSRQELFKAGESNPRWWSVGGRISDVYEGPYNIVSGMANSIGYGAHIRSQFKCSNF